MAAQDRIRLTGPLRKGPAQAGLFYGRIAGDADASIVVLSRRYETLDVLTLDERHFRTLRGATGRPFRILPAGSPG
jgi:hypothetical protein